MAQRQQREPSEYEWELVAANDVHVVDALKQEGNTFFQQQRFFDAIEAYANALARIPPIDATRLTRDDVNSLEQLEVAVRLNRALAYIELQDANLLAYADEDCSIVLTKQPHSIKALYRRALARERLGKIKDALSDVKQMCMLEPANPAALQLMARLQESWSSERVQPRAAESDLTAALKQHCSLASQKSSRNTEESAGDRTSAQDAWKALQAEEQRLREEVFKQSRIIRSTGNAKATAASNKKDLAKSRQAAGLECVGSSGNVAQTKTESLWAALMDEETTTVAHVYKTRTRGTIHSTTVGKFKTHLSASIHPDR